MKQLKIAFIQIIGRLIPDKQWIQIMYFVHLHKRLDLKNPQTFNEKLQWLKLYYRRPDHTRMVDKYEMKKYVAEKLGEESVVPVLGVWNKAEDIDFNALPDKFVLKVTHDSGGVVICKDKTKLNIEATRKTMKQALKNNYYIQYREWPYKNVIPRIIAEELLEDASGDQIRDYKIFCFSGQPYCIQVDFDRFNGHKKNLYDTDWELLDFSFNYPAHPEIMIERPESLEKMLQMAEILSAGEPYVRIDFYTVNGKTFVGEITFFPASGFGKFVPEHYDKDFGDMIILPNKIN